MILSPDEFIRRLQLHVLPCGFHRIRHYGLLANGGRRNHLAQARELLLVVPEPMETKADALEKTTSPTFICRDCGAVMIIVEIVSRKPLIRARPPQAGMP